MAARSTSGTISRVHPSLPRGEPLQQEASIINSTTAEDLIERPVQVIEPSNMALGESQTILCNEEIQPADWLAKLDLKDAYFTVPMHLSDQELLQFRWQGKIYQFNCLPFGLSSASWAFTKLLKPLVAFFRETGIRLVIYLDDILILGSSKESLTEDVGLVRSVLKTVGFIVNEEKSIYEPSQNIEFLGLIVDTITMSLSLYQSKVNSLIA
ncbi:Uncharacterized protein APZ42_000419 [Daphnia magna]|uniref:Reverse transcriptase domain-containing protein n=1 Tax=Daphnia magna TaxID=35525 RepID=A0A164JNV7_9CRUS|nr:Uncharacterized protein APZ42_000419 [Daphnia magna]